MRPVGECENISMKDRAINSDYDPKGKHIGLERGSEAEWMLSQDVFTPDHALKDQICFTFEVSLNQALVITMEGQVQLTSRRQPVTGKLPNLLHFIQLEALNHVKPGAVSIIH